MTRGGHGRWVLGMLAILAGSVAMPVAHAQSPGMDQPEDRGVVGRGPFGTVPGLPVPVGAALPDPASLDPLDAYGRGATLEFLPSSGLFDTWQVTAFREPIPGGGPGIDLGSGNGRARVLLPDTGSFLVRLEATPDTVIPDPDTATAPPAGAWLWRIAVPDRAVPTDGDAYPPAPRMLLDAGDHRIRLDQGSGCYVGTCGDIGAVPPAPTLPTLRVTAGAPLLLRLTDGSAVTAWDAVAAPADHRDADGVPIGSGQRPDGTHQIAVVAPAAGHWVLTVHVVFDRKRGSFDGYARIITSAGTPSRGPGGD